MALSRPFLFFIGLAVLSAATGQARERRAVPDDWRRVATDADRDRLRNWRTAFITALAQARTGGAGAKIDQAGLLLAPDAALEHPLPPAGDYRCRVVKLGSKQPGGLAYVAYDWFACQIAPDSAAAARLSKLDGSQRPVGLLYDDGIREVFLGAMALGDERRVMRYGRDDERDMIGALERIGPSRWRLLLPYPRWESLMDVVEIVPMEPGQ